MRECCGEEFVGETQNENRIQGLLPFLEAEFKKNQFAAAVQT